jgi:putative hydrolase of the HAD superfamily
MRPLEAVFLDAGGVLVQPGWSHVAGALASRGLPASAERLAAAFRAAMRDVDDPELVRRSDDARRARVFFDRLLRRAGVAGDEDAIEGAWREVAERQGRQNVWDVVEPDALPTLTRLAGLGLRVVVVSNANGTLRAHFRRLGLADRVHAIVDSAEVGAEKPDPRIFAIALAAAGTRAEAALHVGDTYHVDVVGARAAGVAAALLDPEGLYPGADCPRFSSLKLVVEAITAGRLTPESLT